MKNSVILLFVVFVFSCTSMGGQNDSLPFIKGVYGNPGTLLDAGYSFDSLGMNAVFVRSISLNREFYDTARKQGCRVYVEFPTLNGKNYLKNNPEAWPINEKGEKEPPADWFMGICPTDSGFKAFRTNQLNDILSTYNVDGIFLDYLHWHAQFETDNPILPLTCFCPRCTDMFGEYLGYDVPGPGIPEKAAWILNNADDEWRSWRNNILNGWVKDMREIVKKKQPDALLGVFYASWYPADHDSALYRNLGIDVAELAKLADVLSPMLFHKMKGRPVEWVGEYVKWLGDLINAGENNAPLIWPIVQAHNSPGVITADEFRQVMMEGIRPPSSGIMMFSDQSLLQDPEKSEVMKEIYWSEIK